MKSPPSKRPTAHSVRLKLACYCGQVRTLWVDPDAGVLQVAEEHGWQFIGDSWECPKCSEEPE